MRGSVSEERRCFVRVGARRMSGELARLAAAYHSAIPTAMDRAVEPAAVPAGMMSD